MSFTLNLKRLYSPDPKADDDPPKAPSSTNDITPYTFPVTFDTSYFDNSERDIVNYTVLIAEAGGDSILTHFLCWEGPSLKSHVSSQTRKRGEEQYIFFCGFFNCVRPIPTPEKFNLEGFYQSEADSVHVLFDLPYA